MSRLLCINTRMVSKMRVYCSLCGKECRVCRSAYVKGWRVCKQCLGLLHRLEAECYRNEGKMIILVGS